MLVLGRVDDSHDAMPSPTASGFLSALPSTPPKKCSSLHQHFQKDRFYHCYLTVYGEKLLCFPLLVRSIGCPHKTVVPIGPRLQITVLCLGDNSLQPQMPQRNKLRIVV